MLWPVIVISFGLALGFALLVVGFAGWRRPNAAEQESLWLSAIYFFLILFFGIWAVSAWLEPWGPTAGDVPWLALLFVALFIALILVAATPPPRRQRLRRLEGGGLVPAEDVPMEDRPDESVAALLLGGFGLVFWLAIFLLLVAAVVGALTR